MDRKSFDDKQVDRLLSEALAGTAQPDARIVMALKRQLKDRQAKRQGVSLWWLPALSGTAVSVCAVYALCFAAVDWKCMMAAMVGAGAFVLSSWLLTIVGLLKFDSFKEAFKL